MTHAFSRLISACPLLDRFPRHEGANVAPMFAIAMIPILGLTGTAVDYSNANAARTALQAALDTTALMLSKEADTLTPTQLNQKATQYFTANITNTEAQSIVVTPTFSTPVAGNFVLNISASASVRLRFMSVFGQTSIPISSSTEVKWGIKKLELAMVLDNTGSMAQSAKMTNLKTASHNLLTTLKNAAKKAGDVKVAIIPFDVTVKPGTTYKDEFWIDYGQNSISKNSWEGCVQDRDKTGGGVSINNNVNDTTPVQGDDHTWFPAVQCGSLVTLMPLTDVYDATSLQSLNDKIDAMTPAGNTNTTIGLVWGWHALTSNLPLTQGAAPAPDLDKVIIMLTDGTNTEDRWSTTQSQIDTRMQTACANVKAANIKVYTVRVIDGNASLLQGCATNPTMYYDVQQASQLNSVFSSIAQQLATLRISR
ncbi:MAG: pilus assembly protein [Alphaproteobacteria bacterium]